MEYLRIDKNTLDAYKLNQELVLNEEEILKLIVYKELIAKFIRQRAMSLQFDIWSGKVKNFEVILWVINELNNIATDIQDNLEKIFNEYQEEQKRQEEEKEERQE